jgi:hypothetical protein
MSKIKKPRGISDLKMSYDTERYVGHRLAAGKPINLELMIESKGFSYRDLSTDFPGRTSDSISDEERTQAARDHSNKQCDEAQKVLRPLIESLGGKVTAGHITDIDGTLFNGTMVIELTTLEQIRKLSESPLVTELAKNSSEAWNRRLKEIAGHLFNTRIPQFPTTLGSTKPAQADQLNP